MLYIFSLALVLPRYGFGRKLGFIVETKLFDGTEGNPVVVVVVLKASSEVWITDVPYPTVPGLSPPSTPLNPSYPAAAPSATNPVFSCPYPPKPSNP